MRWVFWLFLSLNAAFFYWQFTLPEKNEPSLVQPVHKPAGVADLVLLRERGLISLAVGADPEQTVEQTQIVTGPMPVDETELPHAEAKVSVQSVHETEVVKEPRLSPKEEVQVAVIAEPQVPPKPEVIMACFTLGPFQDETDAGKVYKSLLPLGIQIEQRLTERRVPRNYWVFLPPQKSYSDAREKVKSLESKGVDDMFIMGAGEMKNAVSLGLFKRKSMAISRLNEVRALDASAVMKPQFRVISEKWLELTVDSAATETVARLAELADEQPGIQFQQQKSCK